MILGNIISVLTSVAPAVGTAYGLCEKRGNDVIEYVGGGNGRIVNIDQNGTWSYFRLTGPVRSSKSDKTYATCGGAYSHPIGLRFVMVTRRDGDVCDTSSRIMDAHASFVGAKKAIGNITGAVNVLMRVSTVEPDTERAFRAELPSHSAPLEIVFQYLDLTVELITDNACLSDCEPRDPCPPTEGADCGDMMVIVTVEGEAQAPVTVDTCEGNTINITLV